MKYINTKLLGFVIFEDHTAHRDIAEAVMTHNDEMLSAGFVILRNDQLVAKGRSDSVSKESLPTDTADLLRRFNNF